MLCSRIDTVMHKKTNFLSVFWVHHDNTSKHPNTRMDYPKFGEYDHSVRTPPRSIVRLDSLDMFFGASNMSWHIKSCQPLCRFEFGGEFFAKQPTFAHICHGVLASVQFSIFKAFFRKKPPVIWLNCVKSSHRCNKGEVKLRHKGHNRCPSSYRVAAWRNPSFQVRMICRKPSEPKWMDPGKTVTTPYNFQSLNVRWDDFWSEAGSRLGLLLLLSPPLEPMEKISQSLDTSFLWFFDSKIGIEKKKTENMILHHFLLVFLRGCGSLKAPPTGMENDYETFYIRIELWKGNRKIHLPVILLASQNREISSPTNYEERGCIRRLSRLPRTMFHLGAKLGSTRNILGLSAWETLRMP